MGSKWSIAVNGVEVFRSRNTQILFPFFKNSDKIISEGVGGGGEGEHHRKKCKKIFILCLVWMETYFERSVSQGAEIWMFTELSSFVIKTKCLYDKLINHDEEIFFFFPKKCSGVSVCFFLYTRFTLG